MHRVLASEVDGAAACRRGAAPGRDRDARGTARAFYEGKVAKWWIPDDVVFADELPHTATGKLQKLRLREIYRDHVLPSAVEKAV